MTRFYCLAISLMISFHAFSQKANDYYKGHNCDYLHFVNDSIIDYNLDFRYWGAMSTFTQGSCRYLLKDTILTLSIRDDSYETRQTINNCNIDCPTLFEIESKDYQFKIIKLSDIGILLMGPILEDYQKLNSKRFFKGFLNWPWKWSFKKQYWYNPILRELIITGANKR